MKSSYQIVKSSLNLGFSLDKLSWLIFNSPNILILPAIVLLLAIVRVNRYIMVKLLVLESIISTFDIRAKYVNIWSRKFLIYKAN